MRLLTAWVVLVCAGCGTPPFLGDLLVIVDFTRPARGADCVVFTATDVVSRTTSSVRSEVRQLKLDGLPPNGSLEVGLAQPDGWSPRIGVQATLNAGGCDGPLIAQSELWETSFENNIAKRHTLTLQWAQADAGSADGGLDAGAVDSGSPAGDAGQLDAGGLDAGAIDAGGLDAGPPFDAGGPFDAGQPVDGGAFCDAGVRVLIAGGSEDWKDLVLYFPGVILAVADNALTLIASNAIKVPWEGGTCVGDFRALWKRPSTGLVYVASTEHVFLSRGAENCDTVATFPTADVSALTGFDLPDGGLRLFVGARAVPFLVEVLADGGVAAPNGGPASPVHDLTSFDPGSTYAVGARQAVWHLEPDSSWSVAGGTTASRDFYAVDVVAPSEGVAAGGQGSNGSSYAFNGQGWFATPSSPDFVVHGLAQRDRHNVTAVGALRNGGALGFARWNGVTWAYPPIVGSSAGLAHLRRVRSAGACEVWAVGDDGLVVTTAF